MLHIIQNDPEVPPGNISEILDALGVSSVVHHPYCADPLPDLRDVTALIVLGGSMGANDDASHPFLYDLKIFIRQVVDAEKPYLGICLGGQLLAAALGARVESNRWEELGTLPVTLTDAARGDLLLAGLPQTFATFQWHHDSFDLPEGAVLLASSPMCHHQAFRCGTSAWGAQFHPEATEQIIRDWCSWDPATAVRVDDLLEVFSAGESRYRETSLQLMKNFLLAADLFAGDRQVYSGKPGR